MSSLMRFERSPVQAGLDALEARAPIYADIRMVQVGIQKKGHDSPVGCLLDHGQELAREKGITRTSAGMLSLGKTLNGSIVVIGNAPSCLLSLCEMYGQGIRPALVVGCPVGFVNAAESKEALRGLDVPSISTEGTREEPPWPWPPSTRSSPCSPRRVDDMIDPVSNFEYPDAWVSRCKDSEALALVKQGLAVLTSDGAVLRRGFTTGTTAAAACQAAVRTAEGGELDGLNVRLACGIVTHVGVTARDGMASCFKYSGDYPDDVTAGIEFRARFVRFQDDVGLDVGAGIGRWDHDTPRHGKGEPAISRTAMDCIVDSIATACAAFGRKGCAGPSGGRRWRADRSQDPQRPNRCSGRHIRPGLHRPG